MTRLLIVIMIAITIISSGFIVYKMVTSNKANAHIMTSEGQKTLSPEELKEIEKSLVPDMPGMHSGDQPVSGTTNTLNQVEQINRLNQKQQ